jgi:hypothetical protein
VRPPARSTRRSAAPGAPTAAPRHGGASGASRRRGRRPTADLDPPEAGGRRATLISIGTPPPNRSSPALAGLSRKLHAQSGQLRNQSVDLFAVCAIGERSASRNASPPLARDSDGGSAARREPEDAIALDGE